MWKVEQRAGLLWRVVNGSRVWGANKECIKQEADCICTALNELTFNQENASLSVVSR